MIDEPTHQSEIASPPRRSEALTVEFPALHEVVERRRTPRHMAEAGAYIVVGTESLAVTIREYSREGLFLAFSPAAPSSLPLGDWVGRLACVEAAQSTLVETTGNQTSGTPLPPLQARIIRASAAGLGVNIEELPVEWARLLKIAYRPPLPIADIRDGHQAYEQLIKRCVSVYGTFSRKLASETLTRTANRLGALEGSDPFAAARVSVSLASFLENVP